MALIFHEMSHVVEMVSSFENKLDVNIRKKHGFPVDMKKGIHHHNRLWIDIYRNMKSSELDILNRPEIIHHSHDNMWVFTLC